VSTRLAIPLAQNTILFLFNYSSKNLELQVPKQDPPRQMRQQLLKMPEQYHQHQRPVVIHRHHIKDRLIHTKDHHQIHTDDLQLHLILIRMFAPTAFPYRVLCLVGNRE
jgi:hypothetical protein